MCVTISWGMFCLSAHDLASLSPKDRWFTLCETFVSAGFTFTSPKASAWRWKWPGTRGTRRVPCTWQPSENIEWCCATMRWLFLIEDVRKPMMFSMVRFCWNASKDPSLLYSRMEGKAATWACWQCWPKSTQLILIIFTVVCRPSPSVKCIFSLILPAASIHVGENFRQWTHHSAKKFTNVKSWNVTAALKSLCLKWSLEDAQSASSSFFSSSEMSLWESTCSRTAISSLVYAMPLFWPLWSTGM
mmetsp:Transcript_60139/g.176461  ORF Transcript_60139/g.176461 Transcript_60139/m.176461 type:complete len:245 (+) Transcript_60139:402-1136(+)